MFPKDEEGKFICSDVDYLDTWRGMENCVKLGLTKSIGVSNFNSEQLQRILDHCVIKPVCNQVRSSNNIYSTKINDFISIGRVPSVPQPVQIDSILQGA